MKIRKFTANDYNNAYSLWVNTPGVGLRTYDDSEKEINRFLERNPNTCFIAEENGEIVGTVLGGNDVRRGYIYHLMVAEAFRGRGIGKKLAETVIEALEREGVPKIALFVLNDNQIGNVFWEKLGFEKEPLAVTRMKRFID